ncbi:TPA: alcohol dehydrogenase catalytic domain-containing protein [Neisseria meningitidis]
MGIVEEVGEAVKNIKVGDARLMPTTASCRCPTTSTKKSPCC